MITGVITARMAATRFPGKPLAKIGTKSMLQHVIENSKNSVLLNNLVVATCDDVIAEEAKKLGCQTMMTSINHKRATDRMFEVSTKIASDVFVLIQGDEPMVTGNMIDESINCLDKSSASCVNLMNSIDELSEINDPNCIKVVVDKDSNAMYFSRSPIPYLQPQFDSTARFKQVCIIPMLESTLRRFNRLPESKMEILESIDMLRLLENRVDIKMCKLSSYTHAVDTLEDLNKVKRLMRL